MKHKYRHIRITIHQHLLITLMGKLNNINNNKINADNVYLFASWTESQESQTDFPGDNVITGMHLLLLVKNPHAIYIRNSSFSEVIVCIVLCSTLEFVLV